MYMLEVQYEYLNQQIIDKRERIQIENQNLKQEYREKVKSYTNYQIGQKLSKSQEKFSDYEIKYGNLTLKNSSIKRVIGKWCEQLYECFDSKKILNRQIPFRMKDGSQKFLKKNKMEVLNFFLQKEKQQIDLFRKQMKKMNYKLISQFAKLKTHKQLEMYSEDQAMVGQFTSSIQKINENCLINYLNKLIHGINKAANEFQKYQLAYRKFGTLLKNIHVGSQYNEKDYEILTKQVNNCNMKTSNSPSALDQVPQLITFKIGDLMRCKCTSKESQILALYKQVERISYEKPHFLKILRVKNKLDQGNKDILINLLYRGQMIVEMQLAIKSEKTKFIQYSNKFNHYFYQLKRADLGAIMEMSSIWTSQDLRAEFYLEKLEQLNKRKPLSEQQKKQNEQSCCMKIENRQQFSHPFKCHLCLCFYFENNVLQRHSYCRQCKKFTCFLCQIQANSKKNLSELISLRSPTKFKKPHLLHSGGKSQSLNVEMTDELKLAHYNSQNDSTVTIKLSLLQDQNIQIKTQVPDKGGVLLNLRGKQTDLTYFNTIVYNEEYYLFQSVMNQNRENKIKFIQKFKSRTFSEKFLRKNLVLVSSQIQKQLPKFSQEDCQKEYFILNYLSKILKTQNHTITLIGKNLTEEAFRIEQKEENKWNEVKKLNLSENNIKDTKILSNSFPSVQILNLSYNKIEQIGKGNQEWKNLKELNLLSNNIKDIKGVCESFPKLVDLNVSRNDISEIPEQISKLTDLKGLNISQNDIITLHCAIGKLNNLKSLGLNGTLIKSIPEQFCNLKNLQELDISNNPKLQSLPSSINKLQNLKILKIIQNSKLESLPKQIGQLKKILVLIIYKNKNLKELPEQMGQLKTLQVLSIYQNQNLQKISPSFVNLTSLKSLSIVSNLNLTQIPKQLLTLKNLVQIIIQNNKFDIENLTQEQISQNQKNINSNIKLDMKQLQQMLFVAKSPSFNALHCSQNNLERQRRLNRPLMLSSSSPYRRQIQNIPEQQNISDDEDRQSIKSPQRLKSN